MQKLPSLNNLDLLRFTQQNSCILGNLTQSLTLLINIIHAKRNTCKIIDFIFLLL